MFNSLIFKLNTGNEKASRNLLALIDGALTEPEFTCIVLIFNVYFTKSKILLLSLLLKFKFTTNQ